MCDSVSWQNEGENCMLPDQPYLMVDSRCEDQMLKFRAQ